MKPIYTIQYISYSSYDRPIYVTSNFYFTDRTKAEEYAAVFIQDSICFETYEVIKLMPNL